MMITSDIPHEMLTLQPQTIHKRLQERVIVEEEASRM